MWLKEGIKPNQGVTKRCRLSLLTNSALVYEFQCGGDGGCGVSANEYSCVHHVTWSPNKLWRSTSIFTYWIKLLLFSLLTSYFSPDFHRPQNVFLLSLWTKIITFSTIFTYKMIHTIHVNLKSKNNNVMTFLLIDKPVAA